ncbi:MAG TPA: lipid-A-disaccharide synthase [Gammaproteobacteria bacterium]|nr:lipid-A-disaccharide synthase [Gammaproteobacteria bacterium]
MIVAGEASGDLHAAKLVKAVGARAGDVRFFGIGGERMRAAGVEVRVDVARLAVVGLVEVLVHYREIKTVLEQAREWLRRERPDLLVLTDYPEFNLRLAQTAKEVGIPVLFYISPQVWAWRQRRVKMIRERVDMMAVVFPFEAEFYRRHDVPARFVGHPLVDEVPAAPERSALRRDLGLDPERPVVGLFPGSRRSEIRRLLPIILDTARRLHRDRPQVQFVLPRASTIAEDELEPHLDASGLDIAVVSGRGYDVMHACDAIVTVSGTVTLEIALAGTPMVIINKVAWLTYLIVRPMLKIEHIGLCNIVAGERLVPELIQHVARPARIAAEIERILDDPDYAASLRERLGKVREKLGEADGTDNVADLVLEMLPT